MYFAFGGRLIAEARIRNGPANVNSIGSAIDIRAASSA
jgi:hypothetical protein